MDVCLKFEHLRLADCTFLHMHNTYADKYSRNFQDIFDNLHE